MASHTAVRNLKREHAVEREGKHKEETLAKEAKQAGPSHGRADYYFRLHLMWACRSLW